MNPPFTLQDLTFKLDCHNQIKQLMYYKLFDEFSYLIAQYDPCQWQNKTCQVNRLEGTNNGCCQVCSNNTTVGCSIQSLGCKAFLCEKAFNSLPEDGKKKWRELVEIKEKYLRVGLREGYNNKI